MRRVYFGVIFLFSCVWATAALAEKRVALVIGNSKYTTAGALTNPTNDASDMAAALKPLGFEVIEGYDLDKAAFDKKIREFASVLSSAGAGVFFYAGHGLQVSGVNYLVPVDAQLLAADALDFEMVRLDTVQRVMERSTKTNILFLDACRNNPLARNLASALGTRSAEIGRGLAPAESGIGTLISFSTQPGNVALEGPGRNSPYTGPLVKHISTAAEDILTTLTTVRKEVLAATDNKQVPWENHALLSRFYFKPVDGRGNQPDSGGNLQVTSGQYASYPAGPIPASKKDDRPPSYIDEAGGRAAQQLVKRIISDAREVGWQQVFNRINTDNRRYKSGNQKWGIYAFVIRADGVRMAQGNGPPGIVGITIPRDVGDAILACTKSEFPKGCWTRYDWYNQISQRQDPKISWIEQVDNYFVGAGVYIPNKDLKSLPLIADVNDQAAKEAVSGIKTILEKSPNRIDVSYKDGRDTISEALVTLKRQKPPGVAVVRLGVLNIAIKNRTPDFMGVKLCYHIVIPAKEDFYLIAGPDVTTLADLKDRSVFAGPSNSFVRGIMESLLVTENVQNVTFVEGTDKEALDKLQAGEISAIAILSKEVPHKIAADTRFHFLTLSTNNIGYPVKNIPVGHTSIQAITDALVLISLNEDGAGNDELNSFLTTFFPIVADEESNERLPDALVGINLREKLAGKWLGRCKPSEQWISKNYGAE